MKQFSLVLIMAVAMTGCGKKNKATKPEPKAMEKPVPAGAFTNTL